MDVTAVVAAREGSQRLKNKNLKPFGSSNLLVNKIRQLKATPEIGRIVVTSDSEIMLSMAIEEGVEVLRRPPEYCDEKTKSFGEMVEYVARNLDATETIVWAPCICPLVDEQLFSSAIKTYTSSVHKSTKWDCLVSTRQFREYLWDVNGPVNYRSDSGHVPSQLLPEWHIVINGFFIAPKNKMIEWKFPYGAKPFRIGVPKEKSIDIDDEIDYRIALAMETYLQNGYKN